MRVFPVMVVGGILLVVGGCVALYLGGIWADENQTGGMPALWLIPLAGLVVAVAGVAGGVKRSHRPSR